jgi:RND family efflux transporter MFP subunit
MSPPPASCVRRPPARGARIQLAYATVTASWVDGGPVENGAGHSTDAPLVDTEGVRVVGRRFVDEGGFIAAGTPLLSIVDLDPMTAVVTVPERDYALLRPGLPATLETDAYPGVRFHGEIVRLAPVFNRATRQVRVELSVENRDGRLKPGMFLRAQLELDRLPDAVVVPFAAIAEREGQPGLFVLDPSGERVHWHRVELGVREEAQIAVEGEGLRELADAGRRVVVLGQELCDDGSAVRVIEPETPNAGAPQR